MKTYPVNLVLEDKLVILIGAKGEIVGRIAGLLDAGATVRVIAPSADPRVETLAAAGEIEWQRRRYQPGDLSGAAMVVALTNNGAVHDQIWAEGRANNQLVNVMDVIPQCNFHGASFMRRGHLTIALGTGGAAPALAVTLRKRFEQEFGEEYADFLEYAQSLRPHVKRRIPRFRARVDFWYALVESEALALLREEDYEGFQQLVDDLLSRYEAEARAPELLAA